MELTEEAGGDHPPLACLSAVCLRFHHIPAQLVNLAGSVMRPAHGCIQFLSLVLCAPQHYLRDNKGRERTEDKTMFTPIRKIARALRVPTAAEREMNYLNGARDLVDLEYRQREIDRGMFRRG